MAPPAGTLRVGRYFGALIVVLGLLYLAVFFPGVRHTPKLGIDLVGGKRVIFTAQTPNHQAPSAASMDQARQIIENRVNGQGVTGATVQVQGGNQLVVLIPGGTQADVAELGQPAVLNFRPLIAPAVQVTCTTKSSAQPANLTPPASTAPSASSGPSAPASASSNPSSQPTGGSSAAGNSLHERRLAAGPSGSASSSPATPSSGGSSGASNSAAPTSSGAAATPSAAASAAPSRCLSDPLGTLTKASPSLKVPTTEAQYNQLTSTQRTQLQTALTNFDCSAAVAEADVNSHAYLACDPKGDVAYLLGSVIVPGTQIGAATASAPNSSGQSVSGQWTVALQFKGNGSKSWAQWTSQHNTAGQVPQANIGTCGESTGTECSDFVAFTLNGQVVSSPYTMSTINSAQTQISGNFTQTSAMKLAQQLNFGKLPLSFRPDSNQSVSATLGTVQLKAAFLAGGIGLALVIIYSLAYYRGLGIVTIASLVVSAGLTYAMLVILGEQIGFTLDLAGIAGFIVALGITADSFVVFFERIKDEVHDGRSIRVAVPRAWVRARRTILSADTVSFLAAAILYYFASADVRGFAFTLGLSTILDLVVVFLFTHPIVSLLSRSRAFGSPRFTGLNSLRSPAAVTLEQDARRGRPARGGARSAGAGRAGTSTARDTSRAGSVAVLDDEDRPVDEPPGTSGATHDEDVVDETPPATGEAPPPTSRPSEGGSPQDRPVQGGTAAERAAARRARMREQRRNDGGTS